MIAAPLTVTRYTTLATTKKADASAMACQEEAGHVDAPCEWWGLE
ncbi:MAG TPA: hypothetical protein VFX51_02705 [Solirubrobacteraceae bacterium]|nr:hypothetical protein [Solirubrobacteraceae bacterium]